MPLDIPARPDRPQLSAAPRCAFCDGFRTAVTVLAAAALILAVAIKAGALTAVIVVAALLLAADALDRITAALTRREGR